jgi:hypothetical protein
MPGPVTEMRTAVLSVKGFFIGRWSLDQVLYALSHIEPSGNAPVRPGYNELTLQLATAACHVQRPNRNYLTKTSIKLQNYRVVHMSGMYLRMCCKPYYV